MFSYYELVGIVSYGVGCNSSVNGKKYTVKCITLHTSWLFAGLKIPGIYSRIGMVVEWIHHLTDSGVYCAKEKVEKEHEGKHIIEVNRKVDKNEAQGGKD